MATTADLEAFINEHRSAGDTALLTDLYRDYRHVCEARGARAPSLGDFQQALIQAGLRRGETRDEGRSVFYDIRSSTTSEKAPYIAVCLQCGGATWGWTGLYEPNGSEIWHCFSCVGRVG